VEAGALTPTHARALQRIADRIKADTLERNRLIVEAHRDGASLREIAQHAGVSHVAVLKIVRKAESSAPQ
jgi:transposase